MAWIGVPSEVFSGIPNDGITSEASGSQRLEHRRGKYLSTQHLRFEQLFCGRMGATWHAACWIVGRFCGDLRSERRIDRCFPRGKKLTSENPPGRDGQFAGDMAASLAVHAAFLEIRRRSFGAG